MSQGRNIRYSSAQIPDFYSGNRIKWSDFYPSERHVLERIGVSPVARILDLGCACGGLGSALRERFGISHYSGIDVSEEAIAVGREMNPWQDLQVMDVVDLPHDLDNKWDLVLSFSCIDWNVDFDGMFARMWELVSPGGRAVVSVRLTSGLSSTKLGDSYQFVSFGGQLEGERAPYVVFSLGDWMKKTLSLPLVAEIYGYGYWGAPSSTAVTKYKRLVFAVFSMTKGSDEAPEVPVVKLEVPDDL